MDVRGVRERDQVKALLDFEAVMGGAVLGLAAGESAAGIGELEPHGRNP